MGSSFGAGVSPVVAAAGVVVVVEIVVAHAPSELDDALGVETVVLVVQPGAGFVHVAV